MCYNWIVIVCRCPQRPEEVARFLGAGVIDICELLHVGAGI